MQFQCLPEIKNVWKIWDTNRNQDQYALEEFHAVFLKKNHWCPETGSFTQCAKGWSTQSRGIWFIFSFVQRRVVDSKSTKPAYWLSKLCKDTNVDWLPITFQLINTQSSIGWIILSLHMLISQHAQSSFKMVPTFLQLMPSLLQADPFLIQWAWSTTGIK